MVFQSYALYPAPQVADNIGYPLKIRKVPPAERQRQVTEVARRVELDSSAGAPAEGTLRRPAPARRACPRHHPHAARLPHGRAAVESRRQAPRPDARRAEAPSARAAGDDHLRHPRPDRGDDARPPRRRDEQRRHRAARHAEGNLQQPAHALRRRLHRLAADEPDRRARSRAACSPDGGLQGRRPRPRRHSRAPCSAFAPRTSTSSTPRTPGANMVAPIYSSS